MLYDSDLSSLLSKWEATLGNQSSDYKIAVRDCMYDLKCLIDKQSEEEALANEAFEQQLKEDCDLWNEYLSGQYTGDGVIMA